ncbi:MAG: hypothetical protein V7750_14685 [Sneathiella sp.]
MSFAVQTNNQYAYLDESYPGANEALQYTPKPDSSDKTSVATGDDVGLFGEDGFGFDDFLDIINPLQHLPIISSLYREFTGDTISAGSRMIGGGVFGGGIGLAASIVNSAIQSETGNDIGGHVIALFSDDEAMPDDAPQIAAKSQTAEAAPIQSQAAAAIPVTQNAPKQGESRSSAIEKASLDPQAATKAPLIMGLQWKGAAPNLGTNIENAKALQQENLTADQMSQILGSFRLSPVKASPNDATIPASISVAPAPPSPNKVKDAASHYEKQVRVSPQAMQSQGLNVSESFSYLNKMV